VTPSRPLADPAQVDYATTDGTATVADQDYRSQSGTVRFNPGQTRKVIRIAVFGDRDVEADESFVVRLSNPKGGLNLPRCGSYLRLVDGRGMGTIRDDDFAKHRVDDFNDGNADGWSRIDFTGAATFDASSGAYRLRNAAPLPPDDPSVGTMASTWDGSAGNPAFGNGIVRGTVRANTQGTTAGFMLRANTDPADDHNYGFYGSSSFGTFYIERFDLNAGGQTIVAMADPAAHPFVAGEDYYIEARVVGDELSMKAWRVGDPEPAAALLTLRDSTFGPADGTLLGVIAFFDPAAVSGPVQVDATFDNISFTPMPVRSGKHLAAAAHAGGDMDPSRFAADAVFVLLMADEDKD
jgi:hypothetical protein